MKEGKEEEKEERRDEVEGGWRGGRRERSGREVERRGRGGEKRRLGNSKHNVTQMSSTPPLATYPWDMAHTNIHIQPTFPEVHPSSWWDAVFPFHFSMST